MGSESNYSAAETECKWSNNGTLFTDLINTTLNMASSGRVTFLLEDADDDFLREAARLDNYSDWVQAEWKFRLRASLRVPLRDTETLGAVIAQSC